MQLKDKVIIITGSARGMGREFALRTVREGAKVTVCDILDCGPVAGEIKALGGEVLALKTDVTSEQDTVAMARKTADRFGRIDVLVNNAGLYGGIENKNFAKPFEELTGLEWDKMMAVNLKGVFLCCKAVLPYMKKQGQGKIINIGSTTAFTGAPSLLHYATSKGGVWTMTKGLARGLGKFNINVNAIAPGMTLTEATTTMLSDDAVRQIMATQCLPKFIKPEHVAGAVVFLASDDADMITGHTLAVNAGEYV